MNITFIFDLVDNRITCIFLPQMIDTSEEIKPNFYNKPNQEGSTIVIDNGTYELKAGYKGEISMIIKNKIYKYKEKISFEPFASSSMKTMFDNDVIVHFDILGHTIDGVLDFMNPKSIKDLIFTTTPNSPTQTELLNFLFEVYKFDKIQLGYDFIYCYHKYFENKDCVIIDLKYSSIIVSVVKDRKIKDIYKINFGGRDLQEYINYIMIDKYKETRKDYKGLVKYMRVADNYNEESVQIYHEMCNGIYDKNMFLSEKKEPVIICNEEPKKSKKAQNNNGMIIPYIDYSIFEATDDSLDKDLLKEKRKYKMAYYGTMARLKSKLEKLFSKFDEITENMENEFEKASNMKKYITKIKTKFYNLKRELDLRERLRRDAKNKKTREFQIKLKEGQLTYEEQRIKEMILDAEDISQEELIITRINQLAAEIVSLEPDFIPFYASTVEILRGDNIGRQCVNIELIKWPEIFFDPSIIGSDQMGLKEILECIFTDYQIENVLLCGGFSYINNLEKRIHDEIVQLTFTGRVNIIRAEDSQKDCFHGAMFSKLFPVYKREDFEIHGAEKLIELMKI